MGRRQRHQAKEGRDNEAKGSTRWATGSLRSPEGSGLRLQQLSGALCLAPGVVSRISSAQIGAQDLVGGVYVKGVIFVDIRTKEH